MLVTRVGVDLRLITQPDHARLAAEMLSLWRTDGLPQHPRRSELLFAITEHDNGWREADAAPYVDATTGRPHGFLDLPDGPRREIWDRGVARFVSSRPYPALLILEHARRIHRHRTDDPDWRGFFERLEELRAVLLEDTGAAAGQIDDDYRWLALADDLSLMVCDGREGPLERDDLSARLVERGLQIDPFPLAGSTTFRVPCRQVPDRRYAGDAEFGSELAAARWERLAVRICRPE